MTSDETKCCQANGYSTKYSFGSFLNQTFAAAKDLDNITIFRSNFAQSEPDTVVFPVGVLGLRLVECNLDNCVIPLGATVVSSTHGSRKRYRVQNDGRDWEIDGSGRPIKLIGEVGEGRLGRSIDPRDIPTNAEVVALRATAKARVLADAAKENREATQYELQRADAALFSPEDMTPERIAERAARLR